MSRIRRVLGINGSASLNSTNLNILKTIAELGISEFELKIFDSLIELPHFQTELTDENVPVKVTEFRNQVLNADGIIISTPEYIFSIPSGLKNAIEWCVSTTVFTDKPVGIVTASASGEKGHEELKLILKTVQSKFNTDTTLLIGGAKGKYNKNGTIIDSSTENKLKSFTKAFLKLLDESEITSDGSIPLL